MNSGVTFQASTAIYLSAAPQAADAQEAAHLPVAKTEMWSELLGTALGRQSFKEVVTWDPAATYISSTGDAHHFTFWYS